MADLFRNYWWLLFPLFWFISAGWGSLMRYKRTQAKIDLLKTYAASGKEPPAELLANLDKPDYARPEWSDDDEGGRPRRGRGHAFLIVLFAGLAGVFAYTGYAGWMGESQSEFYFIALIMGVMSLAFLASSMFRGGNRDD
ncbi:hypothetical protein [Maricaulis sp.]|uniref:hypothetical protein n=1 Tax=Maricaulis sp. TaxID=1486257 RepID=UPI003A8E965C